MLIADITTMAKCCWPAGNSINLVQLTKRANNMGYHTYVGKGMVLICAAPDTKGKLRENSCETVRHLVPCVVNL